MSHGTWKLWLTMFAAIVASAGGVLYAVVSSGSASDGGRGGAIAVAISFWTLFLGRGTAEKALEVKLPTQSPEAEIARVRAAVASMLDWQNKEKVFLTISSVVGTLAWGFGDIVARWLGAGR